ncbi:MAG: hypothetical protein EPN57_20320 [Paraburkholderia sp.]|nr:MAG: hypothetical protein EPN57_20320 [Paraburkholderia sp.]
MEPNGIDMGDYVERYCSFTLEVAIEQGMAGIKSHYRVWRDNEVALDWHLVSSDDTWPTERRAAQHALDAARAAVEAELACAWPRPQ